MKAPEEMGIRPRDAARDAAALIRQVLFHIINGIVSLNTQANCMGNAGFPIQLNRIVLTSAFVSITHLRHFDVTARRNIKPDIAIEEEGMTG